MLLVKDSPGRSRRVTDAADKSDINLTINNHNPARDLDPAIVDGNHDPAKGLDPATVVGTASVTTSVAPGDTDQLGTTKSCLLYTSPSPRDATLSRMPSSA